jgi:hypothetical protein
VPYTFYSGYAEQRLVIIYLLISLVLLFRAADDELLRGITGKFSFIVAAVLVLDQKTVIPEQGIDLLGEKLPHVE